MYLPNNKERLDGLCKTSVHRERMNLNKGSFIQYVINMLGIKRRNFQFLFTDDK